MNFNLLEFPLGFLSVDLAKYPLKILPESGFILPLFLKEIFIAYKILSWQLIIIFNS